MAFLVICEKCPCTATEICGNRAQIVSICNSTFGTVDRRSEVPLLLNSDSTQTAGLLDQVRKGDRSAINVLLALNRSYLRRVIELRMDERLRGRLDASDVVQETQLAAAQRLDEYLRSPAISFRLWLRQTAIERLIDLRRRHLAEKRTPEREVPLPEHSSVALAHQLLERWLMGFSFL